MAPTLDIRPVDETASDPDIASVTELVRALEVEINPSDEPVGMAEVRGRLHRRSGGFRDDHLVAFDPEGRALGLAAAHLNRFRTNRDRCEVTIDVHPAARLRGVGSVLLAQLVQLVAGDGRVSISPYGPDGVAISGFWRHFGTELKLTDRVSRADITRVDPELMDRWIARRGQRADGYRLERWRGPCPDRLLDAFIAARAAMNDAPLDDLDWEHEHYDAEYIRDTEAWQAARGLDIWTMLAVTDAGTPAGMTEVGVNRFRPRVSEQGDTGVLDAHRNRGIGRWLKAEMWKWVRTERPDVEVLQTWNAESNTPMLSINEAMGYRPHRIQLQFQGDVAVVRSRLPGKG